MTMLVPVENPACYGVSAVTQSILHTPEGEKRGILGNCLQAAIASVCKLPIEAVPHFVVFEAWIEALQLWAVGRGLKLLAIDGAGIPPFPCVVNGMSPRGVRHTVVGCEGRVVWDPHPSRAGLTTVESVWWFEAIEARGVDTGAVPLPDAVDRLAKIVWMLRSDDEFDLTPNDADALEAILNHLRGA